MPGLALCGVGILVLVFPVFVEISLPLLLGGTIIVGGMFSIAFAAAQRTWKGALAYGLFGAVSTVIGMTIVVSPRSGTAVVILLLVVYLLVSGVVAVVGAFSVRSERGWGVFVVSGVLSLLFGVLLTVGYPSTDGWVLGLYVGLSLVSTGGSLALFAFLGRNEARSHLPTESSKPES